MFRRRGSVGRIKLLDLHVPCVSEYVRSLGLKPCWEDACADAKIIRSPFFCNDVNSTPFDGMSVLVYDDLEDERAMTQRMNSSRKTTSSSSTSWAYRLHRG